MLSCSPSIKSLQNLSPGETSWDYLGTNLSFKLDDDTWSTETNRLLLMDTRDFNRLGVGTDDLIDAYIQVPSATPLALLTTSTHHRENRFSSRLCWPRWQSTSLPGS